MAAKTRYFICFYLKAYHRSRAFVKKKKMKENLWDGLHISREYTCTYFPMMFWPSGVLSYNPLFENKTVVSRKDFGCISKSVEKDYIGNVYNTMIRMFCALCKFLNAQTLVYFFLIFHHCNKYWWIVCKLEQSYRLLTVDIAVKIDYLLHTGSTRSLLNTGERHFKKH